jgi:hypothetical protein
MPPLLFFPKKFQKNLHITQIIHRTGSPVLVCIALTIAGIRSGNRMATFTAFEKLPPTTTQSLNSALFPGKYCQAGEYPDDSA